MIRSVFPRILFCFAFLLSFQAEASRIVVFGPQEALGSTEAAQAFSEQLQQETQDAENRVKELELQARDLREQLQGGGLAQEDAQRVQLQFQKAYSEYQRQLKALQNERAKREQAFVSEMRPKLDAVIKELIEEQDISLILNRQSTVYMEAGVDITAEVVKRLNAR